MGDRISFSFTNKIDKTKSVAFFSHWDGEELLDDVEEYLQKLSDLIKTKKITTIIPLGRLESNTVMLDFINWFFKKGERIESNYYLGKNEFDGDNSDNGHHQFELSSYLPKEKKEKLEEFEDLLNKNKEVIIGALTRTNFCLDNLKEPKQ